MIPLTGTRAWKRVRLRQISTVSSGLWTIRMARSYTTAAHRRERARINRERRARGETIVDSRGNNITAGRKVARGGHPTDILTPHLIKAIAEVTARGVFPHHAAASLGVN